ncbi:MAG: extracellular solute-binding protein [Streptosporangiales bacterium]|nr:extracellular solute-binding protein [Streptosporangiales bacterium]
MRSRRPVRLTVVLSAMSLLSAACLGPGGGEGGGENVVTVLGTWTDAEAKAFEESVKPFEEETGVDVKYEGSRNFTELVVARVQGGNPPDISTPAQPGLLSDLVQQDAALPLSESVDVQALQDSLIPGLIESGQVDGEAYGLPMKLAVKSALWYPVPEFEEAGYQVPETYPELVDLQRQIARDGETPWCIGAESAESTGWPITDWIEEYVLRLHGPEVYDQWISHELPFNSPEIKAAFEEFGKVVNTKGNVAGGARGVLATNFGDSPQGLFEDPPNCYLERQANFITGFYPEDVQGDLDSNVGATYFPSGIQGGYQGDPVLVAGEYALLMTDNPDAKQLMKFLAQDSYGQSWAETGGYLSPHQGFDTSVYPDDVTRSLQEIAAEADVARFDGSDAMPGPVGSGSFWTESVAWLSGDQDLDTTLKKIDESWPE